MREANKQENEELNLLPCNSNMISKKMKLNIVMDKTEQRRQRQRGKQIQIPGGLEKLD